MNIWLACKPVHLVCAWYLRYPEEGIQFLVIGDSCELPCVGTENHMSPVQLGASAPHY